jgi:RimJ/RimL family protein N-acetyltransferase
MVAMADIPVLETARVRLRPYRLTDFEAYAALWAAPDVVRFLGGTPFTREQAWIRFLRQIGLWHHLGFGFWVIEDRASGAFAGECGFHDLQRGLTPTLDGTMETGWGLAPSFHGRGLAEEAIRAALAWADENGTRDRLTALIDPANAASLKLARKAGFVEVAQTTYHGAPIILLERSRRWSAGEREAVQAVAIIASGV